MRSEPGTQEAGVSRSSTAVSRSVTGLASLTYRIRRSVLEQSLRSGPVGGAQNGIFCRAGEFLANTRRSSVVRLYDRNLRLTDCEPRVRGMWAWKISWLGSASM